MMILYPVNIHMLLHGGTCAPRPNAKRLPLAPYSLLVSTRRYCRGYLPWPNSPMSLSISRASRLDAYSVLMRSHTATAWAVFPCAAYT